MFYIALEEYVDYMQLQLTNHKSFDHPQFLRNHAKAGCRQ